MAQNSDVSSEYGPQNLAKSFQNAATEFAAQQEAVQERMEADPTSIADQRYGLLMQIKGIMAGFNGLEQFNRFAFRAQVHEKRLGTFLTWREEMYAALGVYNTMLQVIDLKNRRKRDARDLETIIEYRMMQVSTRNAKVWRGIATNSYADLNLNIEDLYERLEHAIINDYARIEEMFAMRGVEPDPAIVAGWYAYEAMERAYAAAYMTLITLMDDVNEAYGWKHFQISNLEYRRYLSDLHFETIRGEQNTSIDEKAILQLMIYAAYNGLELKTPIDKISGQNHTFNISDLFRVASNVQCIGWLKEYHKVQFGAEWEQIHKVFGEMMALTEGPLINKFRAEVEYSEPLQIIWDKVGQSEESQQRIQEGYRGDAIFQTIDQDFWRSGELTGTVQAYFDFDFRFMPSPQYAVVSFFAGDPGCLSAETLVETISGPKRIEDLMGCPDLKVLSFEKDGSYSYRQAIPIRNKRQRLYRLSTTSGTVLATADHKFLRLDGRWQTLQNLRLGDQIATFGKETCLETFAQTLRKSRLSEGNVSASCEQKKILQPRLCENNSFQTNSEKENHSHLPKRSLWEALRYLPEQCTPSFLLAKLLHVSKEQGRNPIRKVAGLSVSVEKTPHELSDVRGKEGKVRRDVEISQTGIRRKVGSNSPRGIIGSVDRLLRKVPRKTPEQQTETEQNDEFRANSSSQSRDDESRIRLEQVRQSGGQILVSRFSDQEFRFRDRSEWGSLASGLETRGRTACAIEGGWTLSDSFDGDRYSFGACKNLSSASILAIEPDCEADTFDLHVPGTNSYVLSCGLIVHNSGKSTILSRLAAQTVIEHKAPVLIPLSETSNWPTLAFMPYMKLPGNLSYSFCAEEVEIPPQGIPVLTLNIVDNMDVLNGEILTKYDRVIKVEKYENFSIDIPDCLNELQTIAEGPEFGYDRPAGIISVRNLGRQWTDDKTHKPVDMELRNAINVWYSALAWKMKHTQLPMRSILDEAADAGTNNPSMRENVQMRNQIEKGVRSARRFGMAMDIATQLTREISPQVRRLAANTFWRGLTSDRTDAESPLENLLATFAADDEDKEIVRQMTMSKIFQRKQAKHLMFWYNRLNHEINLVQPMPAPFMPQIVSKENDDIYKIYCKRTNTPREKLIVKNPGVWREAGVGDVAKEQVEKEFALDTKSKDSVMGKW